MSDTFDRGGGGTVRSLKEAIRRVRTAEAERSDVVVELRDAERARLEMLADELRSVFAEIPEDNEAFALSIAGGTPPRLWIDMTSFVVMDRDRRTYRFLKDTRLGRTVILETADLDAMADMIVSYVAERIIERERAIEADWVLRRPARGEDTARRRTARSLSDMLAPADRPDTPDRRVMGWVVAAFLGGLLIGMIGLLGYVWVSSAV
ncbi:MAG TPA: hypothetical protein VFK86_05710 [Bauldia sp.]|nr:hypothetical protein [Bauldia sp.]